MSGDLLSARSDASDRIDEICDAFEQSWRRGSSPPSLEEFAARARPDVRLRLLSELIPVDLECRWSRAGGRTAPELWKVEDYQRRFPEVLSSDDQRLRLILVEYRIWSQFGDPPAHDSYRDRFPELFSRLVPLLQAADRELAAAPRSPARSMPDQNSSSGTFHASTDVVPVASGSESAGEPTVAPSSIEAPAVPTRIGRYRIDSELGCGGFGTVYLGWDENLQRKVAIKVPRSDRVTRPEDMQQYIDEGRTLAGLQHPGIVQVYDSDRTPEGSCYVVSRYVPGSDLARRLREGRLPHRDSAALIAQVADALHYAHNRGVFHRDVKPANILLDERGQPILADFGLALRDEEFGHGPGGAGTPAYMSPEQARGEGHHVDGRSDIFSLGAVFYEMLTGRRAFQGNSIEILDQIVNVEARPPRQIDDSIPPELERICLKAMAKRLSDRYPTASDFAADLRHSLHPPERTPAVASVHPVESDAASPGHPRIVPKGLRSFDAADADFFLELLPGPRDRDGIPASIRYWKSRIERTENGEEFCVGLIFGPSGCGKSSLVRAGLLPRLASHVTSILIEATGDTTEERLQRALQRRLPDLPAAGSLSELLKNVRLRRGLRSGQKVVIVLDQFEQWLHAHREPCGELVEALRHCDGENLQCLLLVRDDFWMAVTRFLNELKVEIAQDRNLQSVDLFDLKHARKVLHAIGHSYGRLPESAADLSRDESAFLDLTVNALAREGRIICLRLALFADMVKGRTWSPATWKEVGGAEGVGVAYLDESFCSASAPPTHRLHEKAARKLLQALLPPSGSNIRGTMRTETELAKACGYDSRPQHFIELVRILDKQVCLITPTDPEGISAEDVPESPSQPPSDAGERHYQLTHDYLVPALREWLTRKQKSTRRGRAELLLAERAAAWTDRPTTANLPTLWEQLRISLLTTSNRWSDRESRLMKASRNRHALQGGAAICLGIALLFAFNSFSKRQSNPPSDGNKSPGSTGPENLAVAGNGSIAHQSEVDALISTIASAPTSDCSAIIQRLQRESERGIAAVRSRLRTLDARRTPDEYARLAVVALYLGDYHAAAGMARATEDPIDRESLIDTLVRWNAGTSRLLSLAEASADSDLQSAVCIAIGRAEAPLSDGELIDVAEILQHWFSEAPDAGTRGAAGWALRKLTDLQASLHLTRKRDAQRPEDAITEKVNDEHPTDLPVIEVVFEVH